MKKISIITPCFNEADNIKELYKRVSAVINEFHNYIFELIFIDNCSTDETVLLIKEIIKADKRVRLIVNTRNFGHIASPYYGLLQCEGDAVIYLASDLQDPPEYISEFLGHWESGFKLVMGTKPVSKENKGLFLIRKLYYGILDQFSEIPILKDATGFGLYDNEVIKLLRQINDPYPFLRGLICYLGYEIKSVQFEQPRRVRGITKNNLYTLYDIGILGIISHSKLPIRILTFFGLLIGFICILLAFIIFIMKLTYWNHFPLGIAPLIIGFLGLFGILFIFIGMIGEYIFIIHLKSQNRPIVIEKERINFEKDLKD